MTGKAFADYVKLFHTSRRQSISSKQLDLKFGVKKDHLLGGNQYEHQDLLPLPRRQ